MSTTKAFSCIALFAILAGCSEVNDEMNIDLTQEFSIKGIHGISLGVVDKELPEGYIIENKEIEFTPKEVDERFIQYRYSTTPKSHIVYGIKAKSKRELSKETCLSQRDSLIEQTLSDLGDTSQFKITEEKNKWKVREANQREITIDCETSISPDERQLVMIYQDTALSLLAFREWRKRQKEITLIRF